MSSADLMEEHMQEPPNAQQAALSRPAIDTPFTWKQFSVCGSRFVLPDYYSVIKPIGQGAYGIVCSATNQRTGKNVAIKKIANAFEHVIDTKRTLREAKLLRMIKHENVISIEDILPPVDFVSFNDVYVISELMDTDLHQIITSPQPLSDDHVQYFMYQILRGMKYIHSLDVVHRDLKPSNLLVNSNCDLKICDFGLARALGPADDQSSFLTEYVATRWYRAPEVLVSWCRYSKALDMWSVGCILAELLGRKPIFPGKNFKHQIELICNILGTPTSEDLVGVTSERAKQYLENLLPRPKKDFRMIYTTASAPAIELLEKLLTFDPERRFTVEDALACNFLSSLHDENDEPRADHPLNFDWEIGVSDQSRQTRIQLKKMMYEECRQHYHPTIPSWPEEDDREGGMGGDEHEQEEADSMLISPRQGGT